jgi:Cu-Zn family superoxide dismutase
MNTLRCLGTAGGALLLATAMALPAAGQSAIAILHDKTGKEMGRIDLLQAPEGVLLKVSLKDAPAGEHAFHIHAAAKCDPPTFDSAGPHFNPTNEKHGLLAGHGHAGDMPNLYVPKDGELEVEILNPTVTLAKGKPNSLFQPAGTTIVLHEGVDDYKTDPAGNSGARIACGAINEIPATVGGTAR